MRRIGRILRWALHGCLFVLCLEIAARVDDRITYGAPLWSRYDPDVLRERDADGIPRNVSGARFEKWKINSLGFRGEEVDREKPAGRRRIVCLGQSETFGLYEREGGEWPSRLARFLRSKYPDVEVINASVVGTSRNTRQDYLEKYVLPFRPDVVVLYLNVLADGTAPESAPVGGGSAPGPSAGRMVWPQSRLLPKLKPRLRALVPERAASAVRSWRIDEKNRRLELAVLGGRPPRDALPDENVASFERYVRQLVQFLRQRGVAPVLATYPTLVNEGNASQYHLQIANERYWYIEFSERGLLDMVRKLNAAVRRVAADLAVPLVDVDDSMPKTLEFFGDYNHYNDAGAELVARRVLEVTEEAGLLVADERKTAAVRSAPPAGPTPRNGAPERTVGSP